MKKGIIVFFIFIFSMMLSGCGIPHGESIEDCRTMSQCYYNDKSVRTEGSEMSNELKTLLLNEEDDLIFFYSRNPGGEYVYLVYHSVNTLSHESIDEISNILINVIDVVNNHYIFDEIEVHIEYGNTDLIIHFDENKNTSFISSRIDMKTYGNADDFSEEDIISNLESNADTVKLLIDYFSPAYITWFGIGKITIITEIDSISIWLKDDIDTSVIRLKIEELLDGYNINFNE